MGMFPLGITAELMINGTFVDITRYLYQRDGIHVTAGAVNWGDTPQPATCTFTVNNRDGRFTPNYASGAYYPYLQRNVQVRISVTATSSSGNFYSGYRFWGQVSEWPPLSDISGRDVYVQVIASGPLRQVNAGGGQGSALTRYYNSLAGSLAPVAYWPCEEEPGNSGTIGAGISGGQNMAVITGTPAWKAISSFNGSEPVPVVNNSTWDGLTGSFGTSGDDIFLIPGSSTWVASTTTVNAKVWGAGAGGANGGQEFGGGGAEFAQEATLAVTPGTAYTVIVGAAGAGGALSSNGSHVNLGSNGGDSSIQGDSVLVRAHGGKAGISGGGTGGTGSVNTVHFNGGNGGGASAFTGGSGGGSSAGTAAPGTNGAVSTGGTGGAGGTAPAGGGNGGHGGNSPGDAGGQAGLPPGGGGGGGCVDNSTGAYHGGFPGAPGKVELVYTSTGGGTLPSNNVIRFILFVPKHGGNSNRVLVRALGSGTIHQLDVLYQAGGKIYLKGYSGALALLFTSGTLTVGDGQTLMVSAELAVSGANVAWKLTAIVPGAAAALGSVTGTQATATMGNVTEVLVAPNADITKTAVGHISVQYALVDIRRVSRALNGHDTEMSIDRFIRLANEQALDQEPQFNETNDHWGFELASYATAWTATNATRAQSAVTTGGTPWSFTPAGTPGNGTIVTTSTGEAALIQPGDKFNSVLNPGKVFTVQSIGAPGFGFSNISYYPMAAVLMDATDTVTQIFGASWPPDGAYSLLITSAGGAGSWQATSPGGTSGQPVLPGDLVSAAADVYAPAALGAVGGAVNWYNAAGTNIANTFGAQVAMAAGDVTTVHVVSAKAPATAAFFSVQVIDNETVAAGKLLYVDNVRVAPRMGVQTRKEYAAFLREIKALDQGILKESKILFGLGYRTRLALINRPAAVTLDYSAGTLSPPLAPVVDDHLTATQVTVKRARGSKVTTAHAPQPGGPMLTTKVYAAQADAQLAALAAHLLNLGTDLSERYPTVTVIMDRASLAGNALAPLMSAVAGVEEGDRIVLSNLPFWMPSATASQLVIGYDEHISPVPWQGSPAWVITWNCVPEAPWQVAAANLRRW